MAMFLVDTSRVTSVYSIYLNDTTRKAADSTFVSVRLFAYLRKVSNTNLASKTRKEQTRISSLSSQSWQISKHSQSWASLQDRWKYIQTIISYKVFTVVTVHANIYTHADTIAYCIAMRMVTLPVVTRNTLGIRSIPSMLFRFRASL